MTKRLQNKVAESRLTLPVTIAYSVAVWLMAGLIKENWWIQFSCFLISVFLILILNNENVLIRVYSRSVSATYAVLTCMAVSLLPSVQGAIIKLLSIASLLFLYKCYQDKSSPGLNFYAFLCIGIASLMDVRILLFLPFYWITMLAFIYSFSIRTFIASLIGLITPYWFLGAWYFFWRGSHTLLIAHFDVFRNLEFSFSYSLLSFSQLLFIGFLLAAFLVSTIHFMLTSYQDKIRVRQIFYNLISLTVYAVLLIALQPQLYDIAVIYLIIAVSPLVGHFFALSYSKISNIIFIVCCIFALIITAFNLWSSLSIS